MTAALADYARSLDVKLSVAQRTVLVTMAQLCDARQLCWASNKRIAATTRLDRRTVQRAVRKLEELKLIAWDGSKLRTRRYAVLADAELSIEPPAALTRDRASTCRGGGGSLPPDLEVQDLDLPSVRMSEPGTSPAPVRAAARSRAKSFEELSAALDAEAEQLLAETIDGRDDTGRRRAQASNAGVEGLPRSVRAPVDARDGRRADNGVGERAGRRRR